MFFFTKTRFFNAIQNDDVEALQKITRNARLDIDAKRMYHTQDEENYSEITVFENGLSFALRTGSLKAFEYLLKHTTISKEGVYYEVGEKTSYDYDNDHSRITRVEECSYNVSLWDLPDFLFKKAETFEDKENALEMASFLVTQGIRPTLSDMTSIETVIQKVRIMAREQALSSQAQQAVYLMRHELFHQKLNRLKQTVAPFNRALQRVDIGLWLGDVKELTDTLYEGKTAQALQPADKAYQTAEFLYSAWKKQENLKPERDYPLFAAALLSGLEESKIATLNTASDLTQSLTQLIGHRVAEQAVVILQKATQAKEAKDFATLRPEAALLVMAQETTALLNRTAELRSSIPQQPPRAEHFKGARRARLCHQALAQNNTLDPGTKKLAEDLFQLYKMMHFLYKTKLGKEPLHYLSTNDKIPFWLTRQNTRSL